jgi:phospholipase A1
MRNLLTSLSILLTFPLMTYATETPVEEDEIDLVKQCVINELINADDNTLVADIKEKCSKLEAAEKFSLLDQRMARERVTQKNRNVLTPHNRNYILPVSYISQPNNRPFDGIKAISDEQGEPLDNFEVKYQLSLKVPVYTGFSDPDQAIYTAFTLQSYWQFYNKDISSPFRETNYEPEVFWVNFLDDENVLWGDEMAVVIGLSHQSNGRSQPNSRSWNRLYANFIWENRGFVFSFKPWYRLPEDDKPDPLEAKGDDNPDIHKYMGYFEFSGVYRQGDHEFGFMVRNNLNSDNRGALQLDWSFPLWGRLRGYAQYFNGYGESMIDYNADIQRFGVGILLTDIL